MALVHAVALIFVFTYASGWDSACEILYQEKDGTGDPVATRESERSYYVDPGFTCEYLVNGEWVGLRKDMTGARNSVLGITALAAVGVGSGVALYNRQGPEVDVSVH